MSPRLFAATETQTVRGTLRKNKRYDRKARQDREVEIRLWLLANITDPADIALRMGLTKARILQYVKQMPDIRVDQDFKPAPKTRRRVRLGWAK